MVICCTPTERTQHTAILFFKCDHPRTGEGRHGTTLRLPKFYVTLIYQARWKKKNHQPPFASKGGPKEAFFVTLVAVTLKKFKLVSPHFFFKRRSTRGVIFYLNSRYATLPSYTKHAEKKKTRQPPCFFRGPKEAFFVTLVAGTLKTFKLVSPRFF